MLGIVTPGNVRSIALLRKLGFARDGGPKLPGDAEELSLYALALLQAPDAE